MKGRKPKPTYLKLIDGNPGHRPINADDEPIPDGELVDPPESFTPRQRKIWSDTLADCPAGLLKKLDTTMFEIFVVAKAGWENALAKIAASGEIVAMPGGQWAQNPFVSIARRHEATVIKVGAELGFSPAARTRVKVVSKKKSKNAFGQLKAFKFDPP